MCVIFISSVQHINGGYRLIVASNRDEYYNRQTLPANYWSEDQDIIGGRDLMSSNEGGTWLALNIRGKLATLLNVFELDKIPNAKSRGQLVKNFVKDNSSALEYLQELQGSQDLYNGFKMITITMKLSLETHFFTNFVQDGGPPMKHLQNGVQGFGNGPFLKVAEGKKRFNDIVKKYGHSHNKDILINELLGLLKWDKLHYPDEELIKRTPKFPGTDNQKKFSSIFVEMPARQYGTRTHTIILIDHDGKVEYNEWTKSGSIWNHQCFTTALKCEI
ncbi:transport and Golgi organization protein 2 homolog isoform X2 [Myzus persicae]|uniref:transport and Golgi organization protein 2 homolog isoform X2 n=1 Tax=Myzus persicae TaxID=13164 RepID=UPI000B9327EA|nr:transport and Golgi organization protein 2 homolog isoform X2 [Myzus persicae]